MTPKTYRFNRPIVRIVIHCTATSPNATVEAIKNYWRNVLNWKQVGYHYIIGRNGERHILTNLKNVTNGVRGYNWNSCHIAYIGGKYSDDRTEAQKKEMKNLIRELRSNNILGPVQVVGHRDLSKDLNNDGIITPDEWEKLCPNFEVSEWLIKDNVL